MEENGFSPEAPVSTSFSPRDEASTGEQILVSTLENFERLLTKFEVETHRWARNRALGRTLSEAEDAKAEKARLAVLKAFEKRGQQNGTTLMSDPDSIRVTDALRVFYNGDDTQWRQPYRTKQGENDERHRMACAIEAGAAGHFTRERHMANVGDRLMSLVEQLAGGTDQSLADAEKLVTLWAKTAMTMSAGVHWLLHCAVGQAGSQKAWADANCVSGPYVSDVLKGRREPGESILKALGLERVVSYRKVAA